MGCFFPAGLFFHVLLVYIYKDALIPKKLPYRSYASLLYRQFVSMLPSSSIF